VLIDLNYIKIATSVLKHIVGQTFPNPPVVSILVESDTFFKVNKIVSLGVTGVSGRPHAEYNAINNFNFKKNKKYTLYSTLEPCCHEGRGPSCVSKIIDSKFINRVVFAAIDPDTRVNGKGKKELIESNIDVTSGYLSEEIDEIYKGYFLSRKSKRPRVFLKLATSLDGHIAIKNQKTKITNEKSNFFSHLLRSKMDAILVGSNTVKVDNCLLTSRINGLEKFTPLRVILSRKLDLDSSYKIFKNCKKYKTLIFTQQKSIEKKKKFLKLNVEVLTLAEKSYNLKNILKKLASMGVSNLLVEGGAKIFSLFLKERKFDDIFIFRGNYFIGRKGFNATEVELDDLSKIKLLKKDVKKIGNDTLEILTRK
jgi:diaminohydroxyphosphoribosylaminopyrimidine deaminase/5-amino-6-(5-phosphoribosylamino)uracil reductase